MPLACPEDGLYLRGQATIVYSKFLNKGAAFNSTTTALAILMPHSCNPTIMKLGSRRTPVMQTATHR
jgi:hypothetical protein